MRATTALVPVLLIAAILTIHSTTVHGGAPVSPAGASTPMHTGFLFESVTVGDVEHRYAVYVPRSYTPEKAWPVIVFLNGSGECGVDGQKQLAVGLPPAIMLDGAAWPFIVVIPQKPESSSRWRQYDGMVLACLDEVMGAYKTDAERVYLTGLSQGGHGTWELGAAHPERFAAIAPVCGWGDLSLAPKLKEMPIWAFHGEKDTAVASSGSKEIVEAIRKLGGSPKLTLYPEVGHNSWDNAYRTEKLGAWFLEHTRRKQ